MDKILPDIEEVLCGVDRDRLDAAYPASDRGLRLLLTEAAIDVPALRIAFSVDVDGAIYYQAVALRETDG